MPPSHLELQFKFVWRVLAAGEPEPVAEYRFAPPRRWRFDFAWPEAMLAVELEGGKWTRGRHARPIGFQGDVEKLNAATLLGYSVLRYTCTDLDSRPEELVQEIVSMLNRTTSTPDPNTFADIGAGRWRCKTCGSVMQKKPTQRHVTTTKHVIARRRKSAYA